MARLENCRWNSIFINCVQKSVDSCNFGTPDLVEPGITERNGSYSSSQDKILVNHVFEKLAVDHSIYPFALFS